jgi:SagB-type dehydrogenase family enzyme
VSCLVKKDRLQELRGFLKDSHRKTFDFSSTDQNMGVPPPPIEKQLGIGQRRVELCRVGSWNINNVKLEQAIKDRISWRSYSGKPLSLQELSFLVWATQGIRDDPHGGRVFRVVPSAGCRHAIETYIVALNVEGLEEGIYRYLPLSHQLVEEYKETGLSRRIVAGALGQRFVGEASAVFVWTAIPYRMEWRYGEVSHKVIALDAGHVCQNLYLSCEAVGAGTCAVAAYDQEEMDRLLRVDGEEEFTIYLASVGKKNVLRASSNT